MEVLDPCRSSEVRLCPKLHTELLKSCSIVCNYFKSLINDTTAALWCSQLTWLHQAGKCGTGAVSLCNQVQVGFDTAANSRKHRKMKPARRCPALLITTQSALPCQQSRLKTRCRATWLCTVCVLMFSLPASHMFSHHISHLSCSFLFVSLLLFCFYFQLIACVSALMTTNASAPHRLPSCNCHEKPPTPHPTPPHPPPLLKWHLHLL